MECEQNTVQNVLQQGGSFDGQLATWQFVQFGSETLQVQCRKID